MPTIGAFAELQAEVTEWRHDLHANPELNYDVHRTAALVAEKLNAFGCDETISGIGKTDHWYKIHKNACMVRQIWNAEGDPSSFAWIDPAELRS